MVRLSRNDLPVAMVRCAGPATGGGLRRHGAENAWRQDEAYWNPDVHLQSLSDWMPLDAATVASGCMQFIPGSHKGDVRWHRHIDDNPLIHAFPNWREGAISTLL